MNEPADEETPNGSGVTNNFHGPTNVAQNSHNVQQTINIGWKDQARELGDEISRRLDQVESEQARSELAAAWMSSAPRLRGRPARARCGAS